MNYNYNKGGNGKIVAKGDVNQYNRYMNDIKKYKPLTKDEEQALFKEYEKTGNEKILEKICKHNLLFVLSVARHYANTLSSSNTLVLEDLINEGNTGLWVAIKKFDYKTENKFISYAVWWIRQSILKCIQDNIKTIRIPSYTRKDITNFTKKHNQMEQEYGCDVSVLEVFEKMLEDGEIGSVDKINELDNLLRMNKFEKSLNIMINEDESTEMIDLLSDSIPADEMVLCNERKAFLFRIVGRMNPKSARYVCDYFGLLNNSPLTYAEISKKYNTSVTTVRLSVEKELKFARIKNKKHILHY